VRCDRDDRRRHCDLRTGPCENRSWSVVAPLRKRNNVRRTFSKPFHKWLATAPAAVTNVEEDGVHHPSMRNSGDFRISDAALPGRCGVPFVQVALLAGKAQARSTLWTPGTSPRKITLDVSKSNDVTQILPPSSRLRLHVVLSVVPMRSSTFSTMSIPISTYFVDI
jgi:hypothetical protein